METTEEVIVACWIKLKVFIFNPLTGKLERGFMLHSFIDNPIHTFKEVYYKGELATKILFKDGDVCYSPTSIDKFQELLDLQPLNIYGNKTISQQIDEIEKVSN